MDVISAFLNGYLTEDIHMQQPEGFVDSNHPNKVCKLRRTVWLEAVSALLEWKIDHYLKASENKQSAVDPCIYDRTQMVGKRTIAVFIGVNVDDTIIMSNDKSVLDAEKAKISAKFAMDGRGEIHHILGMVVKRDRAKKTITSTQRAYLENVLTRFGNPVTQGQHQLKLESDSALQRWRRNGWC